MKVQLDEIVLLMKLKFEPLWGYFIRNNVKKVVKNKVVFENFIFIVFSLGRIEDKIINIIKIPPVNKIKKINGNQDLPLSNFKTRNIIEVEIKIRKLAFIGFFEFTRMNIKFIKIIINKNLIIFLSLI